MKRDAVLITGGNSGIGFECARELARAGRHVIIASRNRDVSAAAVQRIVQECGHDAVEEMGLDLSSVAAVRQFAAQIHGRDIPLRALVCNAGLQVVKGLRQSADGHEMTFAVNHLGHFLLGNLLLNRLHANAPARIVIVASGVHDPKLRTGMPKAAVSDVDILAATGGPRRGEYNGRLAYVNSKLCNLWFAYELERRIAKAGLSRADRPLTVNGFDPGLVPGSGLGRDYSPALQLVWDRVLPVVARALTSMVPTINPADKSGRALARLMLDPELARVTGKYFPSHTRWQDTPSSEASYDAERAQALWERSVGLTGLTRAESPIC